MITLSEAFRLCSIGAENVYLQSASDERGNEYSFWSNRIRELVDMKKIKVIEIYPRIDLYDGNFRGMAFVVRGITGDELMHLSNKALMRK